MDCYSRICHGLILSLWLASKITSDYIIKTTSLDTNHSLAFLVDRNKFASELPPKSTKQI